MIQERVSQKMCLRLHLQGERGYFGRGNFRGGFLFPETCELPTQGARNGLDWTKKFGGVNFYTSLERGGGDNRQTDRRSTARGAYCMLMVPGRLGFSGSAGISCPGTSHAPFKPCRNNCSTTLIKTFDCRGGGYTS